MRIAVSFIVSSLLLWSPIRPVADKVGAGQAVTVRDDVRVTQVIDPDPADETSIAVSALDPQVIVGASKKILGGASPNQGTTRIVYYYSSDGGSSCVPPTMDARPTTATAITITPYWRIA